jgi:hypothetical protein
VKADFWSVELLEQLPVLAHLTLRIMLPLASYGTDLSGSLSIHVISRLGSQDLPVLLLTNLLHHPQLLGIISPDELHRIVVTRKTIPASQARDGL